MPIPISCEYCDVSYQITDRAAGKRVRCKDCGEPIDVPALRRKASSEVRRTQTSPPRNRPRRERDDKEYIRNRRQRERSGNDHTRNVIIGVACGAVALIGGIAFLVYGRGDTDAEPGEATAAVTGDPGDGSATGSANRSGNGAGDRAAGGTGFQTRLTKRGPAPGGAAAVPRRLDVKVVEYPSAGRSLKAWMLEPNGPGPYPALVYYHGGFSFGLSDLDACRPFLNEGFVVMAPSFRGENGNPGDFELMAGEVDDAVAAVKWLATQPKVDASGIFAFGHSVGGGISALVSLRADAPLVHCGGSGGMYDQETFAGWSDIAPFNYNDPNENRMRVLKGREHQMQRDYYGYYGTTDFGIAGVARSMRAAGTRLHVIPVPGDHFSSLATSIGRYLQVVKQSLPDRGSSVRSAPSVASTTTPPPGTPGTARPSPNRGASSSRPPGGSTFTPGSGFRRPGSPTGPPGFPGRPNIPDRDNPGVTVQIPGSSGMNGNDMPVPNQANSDADFKAAKAALASPDRGTRFRAISVLRRSKHPEAAAALATLINGTERGQILSALGGLGAAGEAELLKIVDPKADANHLRQILFPLLRCATAKSLPILKQLQNHPDQSIATMSQHAEQMVKVRAGR